MRTTSLLGLGLVLALPWGLLPVLGGTVWAGAPEAAPPGPAAIDGAIRRGVEWILAAQKGPGAWGSGRHAVGKSALAAYALLHAGLAEGQGTKASRRLTRALRYLDTHGAGRVSLSRESDTRTYEAALLLLVLQARGRPNDRERLQRLADLLCRTQTRNGQWWYDGKGGPRAAAGDNSNTQFALLALGRAHGAGLRVEPKVLARTTAWWIQAATKRGGFGYASGGSPRSAATGSMTAAGIACLAIGRRIQPGAATTEAERVQAAATRFLAEVFSVTRNHGPTTARVKQRRRNAGRGWQHYYLWTVERAMVLSEQERLGEHDWYAEGAGQLLATQKKDGSWRGEHPLYATCFALLFLTRAAAPPRVFTPRPEPGAPGVGQVPVTPAPAAREVPAPGAAPAGKDAPPAAPLPPGTVRDWLGEALAPGVLAQRCRQAGAGSLLPLVTALQDPRPDVRQRAFESLRALLPDALTERVDRHPLPRGRLALRLRRDARDLVLREGRFILP